MHIDINYDQIKSILKKADLRSSEGWLDEAEALVREAIKIGATAHDIHCILSKESIVLMADIKDSLKGQA